MKYLQYLLFPASCMMLLPLGLSAQGVTELEIEFSPDLNNWQKIEVDELTRNTVGKLLHRTDAGEDGHFEKLFYRLGIQRPDVQVIESRVALETVPDNVVAIAKEFLADSMDVELAGDSKAADAEGWGSGVTLAAFAYPLYNPGVEGGVSPAFYEFVIDRPPDPKLNPGALTPNSPNELFRGCVPTDPCAYLGSILVSATTATAPVVTFATEGAAQVAKLMARAGTENVKAVWYDEGFLAGEDAEGNLVATVGNAPFKVDSALILQMIAKGTDSYENIDTLEESSGPQLDGKNPEFFQSYDEFKEYYLTDPLMVELRDKRAKAASLDWEIANGNDPRIVNIKVREQLLVDKDQVVTSFQLSTDIFEDEDTGSINVVLQEGGGVVIAGVSVGPISLILDYSDGSTSSMVVNVTDLGIVVPGVVKGLGSWTSWTTWYAGNWSDQKLYYQFEDDSETCPDGYSGCGPTAWAMLYGWWDYKGAPEVLAGSSADAPSTNDNDVRDCCRYVFDEADTWCVPLSSAAATNPWDMYKGCRWGVSRGVSYSFSTSWGVPYVSKGPRNKARDAIKGGYPSIIGTGFYVHYPFAYGYRYRKYKIAGITVWTERQFKCNMGWGGGSPSWQGASSVWFGQRVRLW